MPPLLSWPSEPLPRPRSRPVEGPRDSQSRLTVPTTEACHGGKTGAALGAVMTPELDAFALGVSGLSGAS